METEQTKPQIEVVHTRNYVRRNSQDGGQDFLSEYHVTRPGKPTHTVTVRCSLDGAPQEEWCNCWAYRKNQDCPHIAAVYEAGELYTEIKS